MLHQSDANEMLHVSPLLSVWINRLIQFKFIQIQINENGAQSAVCGFQRSICIGNVREQLIQTAGVPIDPGVSRVHGRNES